MVRRSQRPLYWGSWRLHGPSPKPHAEVDLLIVECLCFVVDLSEYQQYWCQGLRLNKDAIADMLAEFGWKIHESERGKLVESVQALDSSDFELFLYSRPTRFNLCMMKPRSSSLG